MKKKVLLLALSAALVWSNIPVQSLAEEPGGMSVTSEGDVSDNLSSVSEEEPGGASGSSEGEKLEGSSATSGKEEDNKTDKKDDEKDTGKDSEGSSEATTPENNVSKEEETTPVKVEVKAPALTTSSDYNKNILKWKKVEGASGYEIYRSSSKDKGYKRLKKLDSGNTTSYTNKDLTFNKTYYYKMRAYKRAEGKTYFSSWSPVKKQTVKLAAPKIKRVSASSSDAILKVTWTTVKGAQKYVVYRSTSENGTYKRVAVVKSGKSMRFTDEKRSSGKKYYYKARACRKSGKKDRYSDYSAPKTGFVKPGKVVISNNSKYGSSSVTLKWEKISGASGYEIFRSTKGKAGTFDQVQTVTKGSSTKWTDKNLSKKNYYYKVRAFSIMDGKKVYGAFSKVLKKTKAGWRYKNGYKLYYNEKGEHVKDVSKIIGKQSSYVIKVNKKKNVVTVYAKDGDKGYIIPVKAFVCSTGYATPTGTFRTPAKYRWHTLMGPSYGQWDTRVVGGILFHSVFYSRNRNNMTLSVSAYNKLGTTASHGCIRLTAGDAKWIYDNCKLKTKVVIYNSSSPGPLGKPKAKKLKSWHTWDPTDPTAKKKCKQRGCH